MFHIQSCTLNWKKEAPVYFDVLISTKQEYSSIFFNKQTNKQKSQSKKPTGELLDAANTADIDIVHSCKYTAYSTLSKCGWSPAFVHVGKCPLAAVLELGASKIKVI